MFSKSIIYAAKFNIFNSFKSIYLIFHILNCRQLFRTSGPHLFSALNKNFFNIRNLTITPSPRHVSARLSALLSASMTPLPVEGAKSDAFAAAITAVLHHADDSFTLSVGGGFFFSSSFLEFFQEYLNYYWIYLNNTMLIIMINNTIYIIPCSWTMLMIPSLCRWVFLFLNFFSQDYFEFKAMIMLIVFVRNSSVSQNCWGYASF